MIRGKVTKAQAETIALEGLAFLAGRQDDLERFLALAGIGTEELRQRAADPDMLRALVEFMLTDDALVLAFCSEQDIEPQALHLAAHLLSEP